MSDSDLSEKVPVKEATVSDSDLSEKIPAKLASSGLLGRLRGRLKFVGGALASVAAIGAVAGGLVG